MITITDSAAKHILSLLEDGQVLRLGVRGGGCSGFQYEMAAEQNIGSKDKQFISNGIPVVIDRKSALYLAGAGIDYIDGLMQSGFHISNPNASRTCGCGKSFS